MKAAALAAEHDAIAAEVKARICARPGVDPGRVDATLEALRGDLSLPFWRALQVVVPPALDWAFAPPGADRGTRVSVHGPIAALRALSERATLIYAPTHSSSFDTLVLAFALDREGLPPGVYPADVHMFRNRVIARALRHLGAYQIHRARTDRLYWQTVFAYATVLLERGFPAVVFPSGTRSRTNAVEAELKGGFLRTGLTAQHGGKAVKPIHVVPVTLNHLVVFEAEWLIAYALSGRAHERVVGDELWVWGRLGSTLRRLRALDQQISVRFGDPIPLARYGPFEVARLSADLVQAYRAQTEWMPTHVAAAAIYALLAQAAGTDDVQRLLGRADAFDAGAVHAAVARLDPSSDPAALVQRAAQAFAACHPTPPFRLAHGRVQVAHVPLLFFYRNRVTSSGPAPAPPAAPP